MGQGGAPSSLQNSAAEFERSAVLQPLEVELAADAQHQLAGRAQPFGSGLTRMVQRQSSAVNLTRLGRDSEVRRLMDEVGAEMKSRNLYVCINVCLPHQVATCIVRRGQRQHNTRLYSGISKPCWPDRGACRHAGGCACCSGFNLCCSLLRSFLGEARGICGPMLWPCSCMFMSLAQEHRSGLHPWKRPPRGVFRPGCSAWHVQAASHVQAVLERQ